MGDRAGDMSVLSRPAAARLLLVDDDAALLEALSGTLQLRLGHFLLDTCQTGAKALDYIQGRPYDTIISDLNMPGVRGLDFLKKVKQVRPATPVVLISGHANTTLMAEAFQSGADDFLAKPIDREVFIQTVRQALHISRLRLLLKQLESTTTRAKDLYMDIVDKMQRSNEEWLSSSEVVPEAVKGPAGHEPSHNGEGPLRAYHDRITRQLGILDAYREKVVQTYQETSTQLREAEAKMRRYAAMRLKERN